MRRRRRQASGKEPNISVLARPRDLDHRIRALTLQNFGLSGDDCSIQPGGAPECCERILQELVFPLGQRQGPIIHGLLRSNNMIVHVPRTTHWFGLKWLFSGRQWPRNVNDCQL